MSIVGGTRLFTGWSLRARTAFVGVLQAMSTSANPVDLLAEGIKTHAIEIVGH